MTKPLAEAIEHIQYEWNMLHSAADLLSDYKQIRGSILPPAWMAAVESFVMHVRNLQVFLRGSTNRDDIVAKDFCRDWVYSSPVLDDIIFEKASSQVAHLSWKRITQWTNPTDFDWNISGLTAEVDRLMQQLVEAAKRGGTDQHLAKLTNPSAPPTNSTQVHEIPKSNDAPLSTTHVSTPAGSQAIYLEPAGSLPAASLFARTMPPDTQ